MEEETTQISGDDSINKARLVESGGDGIPNTMEDEEKEKHNSESEVDTLLLSRRKVKLKSNKVLLVGLALFFLWWCLLGNASI